MSLKKKYLSMNLFSPFRQTMNYFPIYSDNYDFDKIKSTEIELEHCKDEIIKLKKQLSESKHEIHLLKINKIILENEHYKAINHIKTFLKKSDPAVREKYKSYEQNNNSNYNQENADQMGGPENIEDNEKEKNEKEENMIITKKTILNRRRNKKIIENFLKLDSLRQHINSLNEELIRKNNIIIELQNNKKVRGYKDLQKSLIKNCNQINEKLLEENSEIKNKCEELYRQLKNEQNENRALKEKLKQFNQRFVVFKELSINKVKKLDKELIIAKEKERNLAIKKIGEEDKEKIENYRNNTLYNNMKSKISQLENDLKKNLDMIKKYKNENLSQKEEIKKIKIEKGVLEVKNNKLIKENEDLKNKIKKGEKIFFTDIEKDNTKTKKNNKKQKDDIKEEDDYNYEDGNF